MRSPLPPLVIGSLRSLIALPLLAAAWVAGAAAPGSRSEVRLVAEPRSYVLSNAEVEATIDRATGDLSSLRYRGQELMGHGSGHPAGYWEQTPRDASSRVTIDPSANGGRRAEVSIKGRTGAFMLEIRYAIDCDTPGVYTYAVFSHGPSDPAAQLGESRFGMKLNAAVFDWLSIDERRNLLMPTAEDWASGEPLNMKEARLMTTGTHKGQVEHKYDYSAVQSEIPAFGWSSTRLGLGIWIINPSFEYLSGGITKMELTGHLDGTAKGPGDPTLLDYWRGTHYGGSTCAVAEGEVWNKVVGPVLVYCNSGDKPKGLWHEALQRARAESERWPYAWVDGVDYPKASERATVTGQVTLDDPSPAATPAANLRVGLAAPDYPAPRQEHGRTGLIDWQHDAKYYEFWTKADSSGRFVIAKVRPGRYTLHAIADGVLGEFARADVVVEAGKAVDLGSLAWRPVRYGRQVWQIGIPDRSGAEFFKGAEPPRWGRYLDYPRLFPNGVDFTVGKSDYRRDWYFEQVPVAPAGDPAGRSRGAPCTWTIRFGMTEAGRGKAALRIALSGVGARHLAIALNGRPLAEVSDLVYNATLNRDGVAGAWSEHDVFFDAALLHSGENVMTLSIPAGAPFAGLIYDCLRLEINDAAPEAR